MEKESGGVLTTFISFQLVLLVSLSLCILFFKHNWVLDPIKERYHESLLSFIAYRSGPQSFAI